MSVGPIWSKGNDNEYFYLENFFNESARNHRVELQDFFDVLSDPTQNANVITERARLFSTFVVNPNHRASLREVLERVAQNWFGDNGQPMWHRSAQTRPAEMHRVTCASEAYLAQLLLAGAERCEFYGQCNHRDFETWITWPREGFRGQVVRVWRCVPDNYLYDRVIYGQARSASLDELAILAALNPAQLDQVRDFQIAVVTDQATAANQELLDALQARRDGYHAPTSGPAGRQAFDDAVREAENNLVAVLGGHPDPHNPAFRGTALAVPDDRGLRLRGDVQVQDLREFLADPREPALNQPADELLAAGGPPADGVRFRWNRALPGNWPPYPPIGGDVARWLP